MKTPSCEPIYQIKPKLHQYLPTNTTVHCSTKLVQVQLSTSSVYLDCHISASLDSGPAELVSSPINFSFYIILWLLIFIFILFQFFLHTEFQFLFSSQKIILILCSFSLNLVWLATSRKSRSGRHVHVTNNDSTYYALTLTLTEKLQIGSGQVHDWNGHPNNRCASYQQLC